jgi:glycerophosphoryl diester phosphodiesterase
MTLATAEDAPTPLPNAHAHNDYYHDRPLFDALDHGFCSVEADIHLVDGALLVAHDAEEVRSDRTLQGLYLDPLQERVKQNGGAVYPDGPRFILMIDFKTEGKATYEVLREVLKSYADMLTTFTPDSTTEGAVTVVVSGDRPVDLMAAEPFRYAGVDGRLSDLGSDVSPHLMPMISDHWGNNFKWYGGKRSIPDEVRDKLHDSVRQAHEMGCIVRFWAVPHREEIWQEELDAGVDLLNADNLARLRDFLLKKGSAGK